MIGVLTLDSAFINSHMQRPRNTTQLPYGCNSKTVWWTVLSAPVYATTASGLTYPPSELCILSGNEEQSYGWRGFIMNMPLSLSLSLASGIFFPSSLQFSSGFIVFEGKHVRISQPALVLLPFVCII